MPKPVGLPMLNLTAAKKEDGRSWTNPLSPRSLKSPRSPQSIPASPSLQSPGSQMLQLPGSVNGAAENADSGTAQISPRITAMPDLPPSPDAESGRHGREASKSFFSNLIASKSSHKLQLTDPNTADTERSRGSSKDRVNHELRTKGSRQDLSRMIVNNSTAPSEYTEDNCNHSVASAAADTNSVSQKKSRSKLGGILNRTKNMKIDEEHKKKGPIATQLYIDESSSKPLSQNERTDLYGQPLKTAPLKSDHRERAFGETNGSVPRTRSADRSRDDALLRKPGTSSSMVSSSLRESSMFSSMQSSGRGVSDRWGKAGKGLLSKITRSGSSTEREVPTEENYVCTTINLPLVQQTRRTRIAKRLELSRDKTEFWMPALPWRCIDYLNQNGCEEEGLYRIPGSGREVKLWQKRFDTEFDINLFDEPDLYDINTIGSMFKSWLRELPDEIMPKAIQAKIARECAGATSTPKLLKDELSKLPPFNYYLLFAITCHLSLLHSFADKNKMDYRNLCICFQPCLKIDAFVFQFLVINWKECWQGCWTEHEYLQEEYRWEREGSNASGKAASVDERAVSSSGSSQAAPTFQPQARATDIGVQRKNSAPSSYNKQRNPSLGISNHTNSSSLPSVPRVVTTPEPKKIPEQELPELGNLSPIRM